MSIAGSCPDDLFVRYRERPLSPLEQQRLDLHVRQCALCRTALDFEREFAPALICRAGDEVLAARVADAAMAIAWRAPSRDKGHRRPRLQFFRYLVAAAFFVMA